MWCRRFALSHYENFNIASLLLPPARRDEYFALYAFARGADDLADEAARSGSDPKKRRLEALRRWGMMLTELYVGGSVNHPTFVALAEVIRRYRIERELFERMLNAFRQDQVKTRYENWGELRRYTRGSANPVGRWVLRLYGYRSQNLDRLSDRICTGLQLVNFIQDVRSDLIERNRVYLPAEDMDDFKVSEEMLVDIPTPPRVRELLAYEADIAERLLAKGRALIDKVRGELARQLILFHGGGRAALHMLRLARYDVASGRIKVNKLMKLALLTRAMRGVPL